MLVILARRWRAASAATRQVLTPMYLTGTVCMLVIGAVAIYSGFVEQTGDIPFYVFSLTIAAIPQGFLYGLLRTQIGRSGAVRGLIAEIEASDEPERLRAALRRALGDPTLELVYWLPEDDTYFDIEGALVPRPDAGEGRAVTTIERRGRRVLQMAHDASLLDDPALLGAATAAAALALRNQTLAGELRSQLREVAASEQRLSDLLEGVRLIAVSLDTAGLITYANPFLCELTGWSREELVGRDWLEVFNGTEVQFLERMANDDVLSYEENWIRTRGGEILDIAWNNTVIRDRDGRIIGATSIGEDVTTAGATNGGWGSSCRWRGRWPEPSGWRTWPSRWWRRWAPPSTAGPACTGRPRRSSWCRSRCGRTAPRWRTISPSASWPAGRPATPGSPPTCAGPPCPAGTSISTTTRW